MNLIEQAVDVLFSKGRVVDLSKRIVPGGVSGPAGFPERRYEIELFSFPPGELMHYISMESHISTHLEAPSHFIPARYGRAADDVSEVSLLSCFGMAVLVNCQGMPAGMQIGPETLETVGIMEGDIVLVGNSSHSGANRPWLTVEAIDYLVDMKKIKMIGFDGTVFAERPAVVQKDLAGYHMHDRTLSKGIPVLEQMDHLGDLTKPRFFFMGFPAAMGGLDSFPIRAVAIESVE